MLMTLTRKSRVQSSRSLCGLSVAVYRWVCGGSKFQETCCSKGSRLYARSAFDHEQHVQTSAVEKRNSLCKGAIFPESGGHYFIRSRSTT